jgi:hypothetical protein
MWKYLVPVFALGLASVALAQQSNIGGGTSSVSGVTNVTVTDCSAAVQTGGTAQQAFGASMNRHGFIIANIDTTEVLWISLTGTAGPNGTGSYSLAAGTGSFTGPTGMGMNSALSVVAATAGHKYTCSVW